MTTPSPSPLSPMHPGNLSLKGIDTTNTSYPLSYERTKPVFLPFPHPKYHVRPSTGEIYEVTSPILEEYDPVSGYIGSVGEVRESVEGGMKEMNVRMGMRMENEAEAEVEAWKEGEETVWSGYVKWPESSERSSIAREAKREREREMEEDVGVRRSKRLREKH